MEDMIKETCFEGTKEIQVEDKNIAFFRKRSKTFLGKN